MTEAEADSSMMTLFVGTVGVQLGVNSTYDVIVERLVIAVVTKEVRVCACSKVCAGSDIVIREVTVEGFCGMKDVSVI